MQSINSMLADKRAAEGLGVTVITNVKVCRRIGGKDSILVCACCGNEVESKPNAEYWLGDGTSTLLPRYNFCPWCSAPLREE